MDVFDLVAKIRLDSSEYESGIGKAKGTMSSLASGVGKGLATVAKVGAAAVTAGVAGVTALTKMGVEGYAQYEQLAGGVETLFKTSSSAVMGYAENAYKTAGMSSNQYMETITSFSASLIQSLDGDTAKAAEVGNMAITDMSDNANKMGTSMEMIQNAYQGFAKQNYTMLDNLKLGYGGTKEEMQRLLDKAGEISGMEYDISSFADISEAIHVIQQDLEISGISYEEAMARVASGELTMAEATELMGTTAKEAASTIEGSIGMMKGAWENLVVGMADSNADMTTLIDNFVESAGIAAENLIPRIEQTLQGIGTLIEKLAPIIAEALPKVVEALLPTLITAGISLITALVNGIITALPAVKTALEEGLVIILTDVFGVSEEKARGFVDGLNNAFTGIANGFRGMVESAQTDGTLLNQVWEGLKTAFELVKDALSIAFDAVKNAFKWCVEQINTDGTWLNETWKGIQDAVQAMFDYVSAVFDSISSAFEWCVEQINKEGTFLNSVWESIKSFTSTIWEGIKTVISSAIEIIKNVFKLFTAVLKGDWSAAWDAIKNIVSSVWDAISATISTVLGVISGVISTVWNGIKSVTSSIWEGIKTAVSNAIDGVKTFISNGLNEAKSTVTSSLEAIKKNFTDIFENCKKIVTDAVAIIKKAFDFTLKLDLKLPHVSVSGGVAPYGIGGKGSLPSFSVEWYKKAYDNAMILSNPTIFGYSAASGKFLGGGDGNGNEIVAGESYLMNLIGNVVAERNGQIVELLSALLEATVDGNGEMVRALNAGQVITLNERELGRAVRGLA